MTHINRARETDTHILTHTNNRKLINFFLSESASSCTRQMPAVTVNRENHSPVNFAASFSSLNLQWLFSSDFFILSSQWSVFFYCAPEKYNSYTYRASFIIHRQRTIQLSLQTTNMCIVLIFSITSGRQIQSMHPRGNFCSHCCYWSHVAVIHPKCDVSDDDEQCRRYHYHSLHWPRIATNWPMPTLTLPLEWSYRFDGFLYTSERGRRGWNYSR